MPQTKNINIDNDILDSPKDNQSTIDGQHRILYDSSVFYKGLFGMILCIVPAAIVGIIFVKIALDHSKIALKKYNENPSAYKLESLRMIKRGRVFAYIGLSLFIVEIIALMTLMSINS